jgi:exodeoxyribonuclease VII large subunit
VRGLSPLATLERGYAVVSTDAGAVLTDAGQAAAGDVIRARLAKGWLSATVDTSSSAEPGRT